MPEIKNTKLEDVAKLKDGVLAIPHQVSVVPNGLYGEGDIISFNYNGRISYSKVILVKLELKNIPVHSMMAMPPMNKMPGKRYGDEDGPFDSEPVDKKRYNQSLHVIYVTENEKCVSEENVIELVRSAKQSSTEQI